MHPSYQMYRIFHGFPRSNFLSCPGRNQAPAHAQAWLCTPHLFLIMYKRPWPGLCRHPGAHGTPSTRVQH